jgi:exopolyphosphatase / guanosine-5'-triphosphate,3'-diphosphate pyrophosphatase
LAKWKKQRLAIIDLGTNSVRFDVHETTSNQSTRLLHREKLMVRLGENVFTTGKLDSNAMRRTVQALTSFKRRADELKVDKVVAFATSALREASDGAVLIQRVRKRLGLKIHVISGAEEAALIAEGILSRETRPEGLFGLIDIGGGSTEISICKGKKILHGESFPLGVARLQQIFLRTIPPEEGRESVQHLRGHIRSVLRSTLKSQRWPKVTCVIGSSGTARALSRMCRRNTANDLHPKWLGKLVRTMTPLTLSEIRELPGMDPKRADLMLAGTLVLEESLRALGAKSATATEFSLRDGILDQELRRIEPTRAHGKWDWNPYIERASHFGEDPARCRWLIQSALQLFKKLSPVHRLDDKWFPYLAMALLFRNTGRAISPLGYEQHSAYIVQHSELPLSESWETEFIAHLCLLHNQAKPHLGKLPFLKHEPSSRSAAFPKLLSLLRVLDALDSALPKKVVAERVEVASKHVRLWLTKGDSTELALLHLNQKKALFEKLFHRSLVAEIKKSSR